MKAAAVNLARDIHALHFVRNLSRQNFSVEKVRFAELHDWIFSDGALQHASKGFFSIVGISCGDDADTKRLMLYQPQSAVTGLLYAYVDGEQFFLIQARAEPGCVHEVQFGPTIQSTLANYMRLHGGSSSPYADAFIAFDPAIKIVSDTTQSDLGERYLMKSKRLIVAEYQGRLETKPGFVWASASAVRAALAESALVNTDLRSLLSLMPWSIDENPALLGPNLPSARKSLGRPVRGELVGSIFASAKRRKLGVDIVALEHLSNWTTTDWGIYEKDRRQGFAVEYFRVHAALREVSTWCQPLINSDGRGYCGLACRESDEGLEVKVKVTNETGLALGWGIGPSMMTYPGTSEDYTHWINDPKIISLASTVESDEGGRFYKDEVIYHVFDSRSTDDSFLEDGIWVNLNELKMLLNTSNICTIQLRGLASHILAL